MSNADQAAEEDLIIGKLKDLYKEVQAEGNSLKLKLKNAAVDPIVGSALKNLFSMLTDLSQYTLQAHSETFVWANGVDNDIEELKDGEEATTQFLPEDALRLKSLFLALSQNLRSATGVDDDVPEVLAKQVAEAILFIDEHALEVEEDGEGEDDDAEEGGDGEGDEE